MWLFDPHRDRIKRRRQPWKLHQNLWQKNNISTNNHITTTNRILTVGPAAGLTCFCPAHDSSLSGSLLSSVPGWLMYGLGKWREAALDKWLQIQWLSLTPQHSGLFLWMTTQLCQIRSCHALNSSRTEQGGESQDSPTLISGEQIRRQPSWMHSFPLPQSLSSRHSMLQMADDRKYVVKSSSLTISK